MITDLLEHEQVVPCYEKFELTFRLTEPYDNPYDSRDVEVWAIFYGPEPTQTETIAPGFYDQHFKVVESDDRETLEREGEPHWNIRFAPLEVGLHHFEIKVRYRQGPIFTSATDSFNCIDGDSGGFVRRVEDSCFLRFDDDSPYTPIGHNLAWDDNRDEKLLDWFDARLRKMRDANENWTRLWMTNWGRYGLAIEWSPLPWAPGHSGVGRYSLESAWKLDQVVKSLESCGIKAQLVIEPHANLQSEKDWSTNPYNQCVDGGFLREPGEFFSNCEARRLFKQRLRYIVARWGCSTSIMAWELFNEVQNIDKFYENSGYVIGWHQEMADFLKATDPANHLITTSSHAQSISAVWSIPSIDLIQPHLYAQSAIGAIDATCRTLRRFQKPILIGEFGTLVCDVEYPEDNLKEVSDPPWPQMREGLHLHNGIWCATFLGATAQLWWWNYIDGQQLYNQFAPLAAFWEGEWLDGELRPAVIDLTDAPTRERLWISTGEVDFFGLSPQTKFVVSADGRIAGREDLHPYLHGDGHAHLRTDPTFLVDLEGGEFRIHFEGVAENGAKLELLVDDEHKDAFELDHSQECRILEIGLPPGRHRVQIRNTGADWVLVTGYEFTRCPHRGIRAYGIQGSTRAYLWFTDIGNQLQREAASSAFERVSATLRGLQDGEYVMQVYGTQPDAGGVLEEHSVACTDRELSFQLPSFTHDIAVKFKLK